MTVAPTLASGVSDRIVVVPADRRAAVVEVIQSARRRLILSLFRCDDPDVFEALAEARRRGVRIDALLTRRVKGPKGRLKRLRSFLEGLGVRVHRYADPSVKYHAKYLVADESLALVGSLNFTRKCFEKTCDFLLVTRDPAVVGDLQRLFETDLRAPDPLAPGWASDRLIVGPELARPRFSALLQQARQRIRIIDPKLTDPAMLAVLKVKVAAGVRVDVLGGHTVGGLVSHGKLILVDDRVATIGSMALSARNLDARREVAVVVRDRASVAQLEEFFERAAETRVMVGELAALEEPAA